MKHSAFVHLHNHTDYSFLDGACRIEPLVEKAARLKMPALAITDHGNMCGTVKFYKACMKHGIKPIVGCEFYRSSGSHRNKKPKNKKNFHITLLARNKEGYLNLTKMNELAYRDGFYHKPRIDNKILKNYSSGLIALSGCIQGKIAQLIISGNYDKALKEARFMAEIFGKENFFLEMMKTGLKEQEKVNESLKKISSELKIECVATNDSHYINKDDAYAQEILMCVGTASKIDDPNRLKFSSSDYYLKSPEEMKKLFKDYPPAVSNTLKVAERCNLTFEFGNYYLPEYNIPENMSKGEYLKKLCREGMTEKYGKNPPSEVEERLESEVDTINRLGFPGYFLICWDFVKYAKEKGIPVGPGRGSGAGSIVSYLLGITSVDPIKYGLLFERFLNPARKTLPDLDIDFSDTGRDRVIEYVKSKYGKRRVAQIGTFSTLKAKAAFKDVARVLSIPYEEADKISKLIPNNTTIYRALEENKLLKKAYESNDRIKQALEIARTIEGSKRQPGVHAAGVVIAPEELSSYVPRGINSENRGVTQFEGDDLVELGLLKMDFLGLKNLTVINKAAEKIKKRGNRDFDIDKIEMNDEKTFKLLSDAKTTGVFQLESSGFQSLLRRMKINRFEDIIALVALYRPGVLNSGMTDKYIDRKNGEEDIEFFDNSVKDILEETYGIVLYQEQVMQIARKLAGFTPSQADDMRKAMSKKITEALDNLKDEFIDGASNNGISKKKAERIFNNLSKFGAYGFNKSHSAAYGKITYQTAFLKANYPAEYMCALLTCDQDNTDKVVLYTEECKEMGIEILKPDINKSYTDFTIERECEIRYGLSAIKNVGRKAIESVVEARDKDGDFKSFYDFCTRVDMQKVNKRVIESLIKAGAFDSYNIGRRPLFNTVDAAMSQAAEYQKDLKTGQRSFFEVIDGSDVPEVEINDAGEWDENKLLNNEKSVLGFYFSGHPLSNYNEDIAGLTSGELKNIKNNVKSGAKVSIGGMIKGRRKIKSRMGPMIIYTIEDLSDSIEAVAFPGVYNEKLDSETPVDRMIVITGRIDERRGEKQCVIEKIFPIEEAKNNLVNKMVLKIDSFNADKKRIRVLKQIIKKYPGDISVEFEVRTKKYDTVKIATGTKTRMSESMLKELKTTLGSESVALAGKNSSAVLEKESEVNNG